MLGHKSATMTLDLYGHLFGDRLATVAEKMDAARTVALADAEPMQDGVRLAVRRGPEAARNPLQTRDSVCIPNGIRTRAAALRGRNRANWRLLETLEKCR